MTADYFAIPTILDGMSTDRPKLLGIFYTFIRGQAKYSEDRKNFANFLDAAKREATVKGEES